MGSMKMIDGVAELLEEIQQEIEHGELRLSTKDWIRLDRSLEDVRLLLGEPRVSANELDDAAWLLIAAFESNNTLAKLFADKLAMLTGGTKLTGRVLAKPQDNTRLVKNRMILLAFAKQVKEQTPKSRESEQQRQTGQRS